MADAGKMKAVFAGEQRGFSEFAIHQYRILGAIPGFSGSAALAILPSLICSKSKSATSPDSLRQIAFARKPFAEFVFAGLPNRFELLLFSGDLPLAIRQASYPSRHRSAAASASSIGSVKNGVWPGSSTFWKKANSE